MIHFKQLIIPSLYGAVVIVEHWGAPPCSEVVSVRVRFLAAVTYDIAPVRASLGFRHGVNSTDFKLL